MWKTRKAHNFKNSTDDNRSTTANIMPCCRPNPHRFHRFHPYRMMMATHQHHQHPGNFWFQDATSEEEGALPAFFKGKARLFLESEGEDKDSANAAVLIRMEVPGVEAPHVTIEESNGEVEITAIRVDRTTQDVLQTYQDVLFLHPHKVDFSQLIATLKDGILTIRVPKKLPTVMTIVTQTGNSPPPSPPSPPPPPTRTHFNDQSSEKKDNDDEAMQEDAKEEEKAVDSSDQDFRISLDLPGVSVDNLIVEVREDQLWVQTQRHALNGSPGTIHMRRRPFEVPPSVDMRNAQAFLSHGVWTLIAPRYPATTASNGTEGTTTTRTFYATPEADTDIPSVASLNLSDPTDTAKEDEDENDGMVETLPQEWEEVQASHSDDGSERNSAVTS